MNAIFPNENVVCFENSWAHNSCRANILHRSCIIGVGLVETNADARFFLIPGTMRRNVPVFVGRVNNIQ